MYNIYKADLEHGRAHQSDSNGDPRVILNSIILHVEIHSNNSDVYIDRVCVLSARVLRVNVTGAVPPRKRH